MFLIYLNIFDIFPKNFHCVPFQLKVIFVRIIMKPINLSPMHPCFIREKDNLFETKTAKLSIHLLFYVVCKQIFLLIIKSILSKNLIKVMVSLRNAHLFKKMVLFAYKNWDICFTLAF